MSNVLDIEQSTLLLELTPPFDKRDVQLARRRQAKVWHPDLAPPGKQAAHERHLQAINRAADQLEQLAETLRGGRVSANAVKVSAAAARKARAEEGQRAWEAEQRRQESDEDRKVNDPFSSQVPDHSVVHRYARCLSYPEWGVGTVSGIYFTGGGDDIQQWARVSFQPGVRTVPADSLQFVDFSKPDPGADRVERFMTAARHALAEGEYGLAAQRLIYARDADPQNPAVLRLMTFAFWQDGEIDAAARSVRAWARVEPERPAPQRFASRIYEQMRAFDLASEAAERAAALAPHDADAWERVGRLALRTGNPSRAAEALEQARELAPTVEGLLDLALANQLLGELGGELTACEQATVLEPEFAPAWSRLAHALARSDRVSDAIAAAERALALEPGDIELTELLDQLLEREPRALPAA
jgi:tetratricopeptide (TPR) repeat protein